ncbi:MAG: hypothetical protein DME76_19950, partial [Verrucomicrobia bacterium]
VSTKEFQAKLDRVVATHPDADHAQILGRVINVFTTTARESVREAFIRIDSRPLLGARGDVWEEPYDPNLTVRHFLNKIWFRMRPLVRPFTYPDGWVLRDSGSDRLFTGMGRPWAHSQGLSEDDRSLREAGINPGSALEVVPGAHVSLALGEPLGD